MTIASRFDFGDVVLVPFPFTDQSGTKRRPAVVVSLAGYNMSRRDIVIMAITSLAGNATQGLDRGSTRIPHRPEVALRLPPANGLDPSGIEQNPGTVPPFWSRGRAYRLCRRFLPELKSFASPKLQRARWRVVRRVGLRCRRGSWFKAAQQRCDFLRLRQLPFELFGQCLGDLVGSHPDGLGRIMECILNDGAALFLT